jgi:hypothetical protein
VGLVFGALSLVPASAGKVGLVFSLLSLIPMAVWLVLIASRLGRLGRGLVTELRGSAPSSPLTEPLLQH